MPLPALVAVLALFALHAFSSAYPASANKYSVYTELEEYHNDSLTKLIKLLFTIQLNITTERFKAKKVQVR